MDDNIINICRPGYGASCALCCGSHNYKASLKEIKALFGRRSGVINEYNEKYFIRKMVASRSNMTGSYYVQDDAGFTLTLPALFDDCPQCPFVGFVDEGRSVGCLLNREGPHHVFRHECFLSYRGKVFSCGAREILNDDEILYAAIFSRDWYYYSILIHEPDLLRHLMRTHDNPEIAIQYDESFKREVEKIVVNCRHLHAIHNYFY